MTKVHESWEQMTKMFQTDEQQKAFWDEYFKTETGIYRQLLSEIPAGGVFTGTEAEMAAHYGVEPTVFAGFLDGINTSLKEPVDLAALEESTPVAWEVVPEKLYFNMREAKAPWLFNLPEWEDVLPAAERDRITREWRESKQVHVEKRPGRNDPCYCGSGKKYKKCCMKKDMETAGA